MPVENVPAFVSQFEAIAQQRITPEIEMPTVEISGLIHLSQINGEFWHTLQQFAPFGPHNMNPVFMVKGVRDSGRSRILANNHVRLEVEQDGFKCGGIGFGLADAFKAVQGQPFHLAFNLVEEQWQGQSILSMQVKDIKNT